MSLSDFFEKKNREIRTHGPLHASKTAFQEVAIKSLNPLIGPLSTPIWESDAQIILVLDACRYDLWAETVGAENGLVKSMQRYSDSLALARNTDAAYSVGSASPEWISNTFADEYEQHWADTAYVTANPFSGKRPVSNSFRDASVYPLRERGLPYLDEVWVDEWDTGEIESVHAETLTDRALWAWDRRESLGFNRMVVHYMQPHVPFRSKPEWSDGWANKSVFGSESDPQKKSEWQKLKDGEIEHSDLWNAYQDNLEWVLQEVKRWYLSTDATILVTSDHGNAIGELGQWGHPAGVANPWVRKVPWVELEGVDKQPIDSALDVDPPTHAGKEADSDVNKRLEALGYK